MGYQFGKYQACGRCGDVRVIRTTEPGTLPRLEWVIVKCVCGRQRARYQRTKGSGRL